MRKSVFIFLLISAMAYGQSPHLSPYDRTAQIMERWLILQDEDHQISSSLRNYYRSDAVILASKNDINEDYRYVVDNNSEYFDSYTYETLDTIVKEGGFRLIEPNTTARNSRKPFLNHFYKTEANFFELENENLSLVLNPIINFQYGKDSELDDPVFQNTRGVEVRGIIDEKVYFHTAILENQARFYNFIENRIKQEKAIPGALFYKPYNSSVLDKVKGWDYLIAKGYVGYNLSKSISIELGHDNHFIGDGIHSLFLSDYAPPSFYLKFNTRIWKLNYQNIFSEQAPISGKQNAGDNLLPKKYTATHYLSIKPFKNVELGLFESIVFARENHFEFQYLNPIILYRTVEQSLDSPDNAMLGLSARVNAFNQYQFYGQFLLDELKISELTSDEGWWGNKYGIQLGLKAINFASIDNLDIQYEFNRVRPYTYAHRGKITTDINQSVASYSHYNQALAHPLGANFTEHIFGLRYLPTKKLFLQGRFILTNYGEDDERHFGRNVLTPNDNRISDYGIEQGQGVPVKLQGIYLNLSYEIFNNLFVDINYVNRQDNADAPNQKLKSNYIGGGVRLNLFQNPRYY